MEQAVAINVPIYFVCSVESHLQQRRSLPMKIKWQQRAQKHH